MTRIPSAAPNRAARATRWPLAVFGLLASILGAAAVTATARAAVTTSAGSA